MKKSLKIAIIVFFLIMIVIFQFIMVWYLNDKCKDSKNELIIRQNEEKNTFNLLYNDVNNKLYECRDDGYISFTELNFDHTGQVLTYNEIVEATIDYADEDVKNLVYSNKFHGMKWQQEDQEDLLSYPQGISGTFDSSYIFSSWWVKDEEGYYDSARVAVIKNDEQFTNEGDDVPYTWVHLRRVDGSPFNVHAGGCCYLEYTDKDGNFMRVLYVPDSTNPPHCDKRTTHADCMTGQSTRGQNGHGMYCFNLDEIYEENDKYYVNYTFEWTWGTESPGLYYNPSSIDLVESDDTSATFIIGSYSDTLSNIEDLALHTIWLPNTENWIPYGRGENSNYSRKQNDKKGTRICNDEGAPIWIQGAAYKRNKSLYISRTGGKGSTIKKYGLNHTNIEDLCFDENVNTGNKGLMTPVSDINKEALNIEYTFAEKKDTYHPLRGIEDLFWDNSDNPEEGKDRLWTSTEYPYTGDYGPLVKRYLFYVDIDTNITCSERPQACD